MNNDAGDPPTRIAMWSGPRNISTAMLRSWENRPDTWVVDEPLYAHYLTQVTVNHPGVEEVIAHHQTDWVRVVDEIGTSDSAPRIAERGEPMELPSDPSAPMLK